MSYSHCMTEARFPARQQHQGTEKGLRERIYVVKDQIGDLMIEWKTKFAHLISRGVESCTLKESLTAQGVKI